MGSLPVWNYLAYSQGVRLGQSFAAIIDDTASANFWDSTTAWFNQPYRPGKFYTMYAEYMDFRFDPPLKSFSAKIRATVKSPQLLVEFVNGTRSAGIPITLYPTENINQYGYYGFNSSVPIAHVLIMGGSANVDDFQYNTVCPVGNYEYNHITGQCEGNNPAVSVVCIDTY